VLDSKAGDFEHLFPVFLPDGRHFLYVVRLGPNAAGGVYLGSVDSKERTLLRARSARWSRTPGISFRSAAIGLTSNSGWGTPASNVEPWPFTVTAMSLLSDPA
jgi:hypothetical protein